MADWSAAQYVKFEDERTRPARDLLAAVPGEAASAVDLGCGPGNTTELIVRRYPDAQVTGLDSSPDMVASARGRLPDVAFAVADLSTWAPPAPVDLLYANAVLQWLPDHETLFPRLLSHLRPGGSLAVQMPDNLDEPSHAAMRSVAREAPFAAHMAGADGARTSLLSPAGYYALLRPHARRVDVWRTIYHHPVDGVAGIVEWFKGSGLRPYLHRLSAEAQTAYLDRYAATIAPAYPIQQDGKALLAFPRLFIVATR